jgi:hypothetical protein
MLRSDFELDRGKPTKGTKLEILLSSATSAEIDSFRRYKLQRVWDPGLQTWRLCAWLGSVVVSLDLLKNCGFIFLAPPAISARDTKVVPSHMAQRILLLSLI